MRGRTLKFRLSTVSWAAVSLVVLGMAFVAARQVASRNPVLLAGDPKVVAAGEAIYARECAACHGARLEGEPNWRQRKANGRLPAPPHDESGHTWHHSDVVLFELTKHGLSVAAGPDYQSDMPAYADVLSDDEIIAVLSYIKSRWPAEIQARHDRLNAGYSR
ncbi:MAG: c-type cytochrome [Kiloniellales bacterium]|nr:c-type cytochrome [Kiloniellales bacterium]